MTQQLYVEYQELMARAAEIEQPLPPIPAANPPAPCEISFVKDAATQIALNADTMRLYLKTCEREWQRLAKSLRDAAKAYEEVDTDSAAALNKTMSDSDEVSASGADGLMSAMCDPNQEFPDAILIMPPPPPPFEYPYYEVKQAAKDIEAGDHGVGFRAFAREWDAFQRALQQETLYRFRPFLSWEGEARSAVEANFDQQRRWTNAMVELCRELSSQANMVVDAHRRATLVTHQHAQDDEHPTTEEIALCDYWYKYYVTGKYNVDDAILWYQNMQRQSEESLARYVRNAQLPLSPVIPERVPSASGFDAPNLGDGDGNGGDKNPFDPNNPYGPHDPNAGGNQPWTGAPGMPYIPAVPSAGTPSTPTTSDTAELSRALKNLNGAGGPANGAGIKPASLGGGGMVRIPPLPLQPSTPLQAVPGTGAAAGSAAMSATAGAGVGRGMPGSGGAMGAGMGGMAPGGQGQQSAGKAKRVQSEDKPLYIEQRNWTEAVLGNRPRRSMTEKAAS
ncbi:PPE domain-containing protein [Mycobacterium sp. Aquia_213]|uniref:PPE domain-containing protein n=1 Tax=Mycobacterium sp. Aquia_213 TaxID=2991728 RepID=UPI0022721226|nr:hypothetical protein [Mycobacterium sp. Aquia_213]WAC91084.1 hypothetical protein LMQ14_24930 [Mycobacterium sp. Aquia_213]